MEKATLREWKHLKRASRRAGLQRSKARVLAAIRRGTAVARSQVKAPRFSDAQKAYIRQCFHDGFWPLRGGEACSKRRETNFRIRTEIVANVAALGPAFGWDSIASHAHENQPGAKRRRARWDAQNRATGVFREKEASR